MRHSRFVNIDQNILIEYIYDDQNLIGEPYNILVNSQTRTNCFVSSDVTRPLRRGFKATNNDTYNQLFLIGQDRYAKVPIVSTNTISNEYPFLNLINYPTSIPVRYDKIRIHLPINYTFGTMKGFYLRVYTFDSSESKVVELSNYYFDMTDIEQNYKLEFASSIQIIQEKQWGKYLEVQIPSVTKISDQRTLSLPKANSINFNLTNGVGLSLTSPIFIDFKDIESIQDTGGKKFFSTSPKKTIVIPQTPEFENLGVRIEESTQGDFFLIYPTFNGSLAEFVEYLDESFIDGLKYKVDYIIDLFEENIKVKTYKFSVQEDFGEEIEFRPIFKYTTTTAIIDVTLRLTNINDESFIERRASYGLLQGGGQRMGSQVNGKITTGNKSGGGGDISKYSAKLTKINLKNAKKKEVINYKDIITPKVGSDAFGTKPLLILERIPFVLFSRSFDVIKDPSSHQVENKVLIGSNQLMVTIDPFDNFLKFSIHQIVDDQYLKINLNDYTELKMTIKGPKKDLDFKVFRESDQNDFENGTVIIKIPESSHKELKNLSKLNFTLFYINGIDVFGNRVIIYSGFFKMWDAPVNIEILETEFTQSNQLASAIITETIQNENEANAVNDALNSGQNLDTSTDTSGVPFSEQISNQLTDLSNFRPRYRASDLAISIGISPDVNSKTAYFNLSPAEDSNLIQAIRDAKDFGLTTSEIGNPQLYLDLIKAYFKGLDIFPNEPVIRNWNQFNNLRDDLKKYIIGNTFYTNEIITGEFLPLTEEQKRAFRTSNIPQFISSTKLTNILKEEVTAIAEAALSNKDLMVSMPPSTSGESTGGFGTTTTTNVFGQLKDTSGIGIADAMIEVEHKMTSQVLFSKVIWKTDTQGNFDLGPITYFKTNTPDLGEIQFRFSKPGYRSTTIEPEQDTEDRRFSKNSLENELKTGGLKFIMKPVLPTFVTKKNVQGRVQEMTYTGNLTGLATDQSEAALYLVTGGALGDIEQDNSTSPVISPSEGVQMTAKSIDGRFVSNVVQSNNNGYYYIEIPSIEFEITYIKNGFTTFTKYFSDQGARDLIYYYSNPGDPARTIGDVIIREQQ